MKNLLLMVFFSLTVLENMTTQSVFQQLAARSNSKDSIIYIEAGGVNLSASSMLFLSPIWQDINDNNAGQPYGLRFDGSRWAIYNLSKKSFFPVNTQMRFNVLAYPSPADSTFIHTVSSGNRNGYYSVINHPKLNGNPNAILLVTQRYDKVKNDHHIGTWYRNGRWVVFNQDRATLPIGAQFNILVSKPGVKETPKLGNTLAYAHIHSNSRLLGGVLNAYSKLEHPQLNNNESSVVFATQFWTGAYNPRGYMLWYDRPTDAYNYANNHWLIYNSQNEPMPLNAAFHILAFNKISSNNPEPLTDICFDRVPSKAAYDQNKKTAPGQYWTTGQTLRILINNTYPKAKERVQQYIKDWQSYANLKFEFVSSEPADIRIAFNTNQGDWSWSGTTCSLQNPSMNLGSITDASGESVLRPLVLRLFAQALGLVHEHQHPPTGIPWDVEAVYRIFGGAPNYWKTAEVERNVLNRYDRTRSQFVLQDPQSILRYGIPNIFSIGDFEIRTNDKISESDIRAMRNIYPQTAPTTAPKLSLFIGTWTDDLAPSSQVRLAVKLKNQPELIEYPLNRGAEWTFGDRRTIEIPLPQGTTKADLLGCTLYFFGGMPYSQAPEDVWSFNLLQLNWIESGMTNTQLVSLRGAPLASLQNSKIVAYTIYSNNQ